MHKLHGKEIYPLTRRENIPNICQTCELARKERHIKEAFGTVTVLVSTPFALNTVGSERFVPSEYVTSKAGNFTAAIAGIIILFASEIYTKH